MNRPVHHLLIIALAAMAFLFTACRSTPSKLTMNLNKEKVVLSGETGFIGRSLQKKLIEDGYDVTLLTRRPGYKPSGAQVIQWDAQSSGEWEQHVDGADAVINLVGEPIAGKRWTKTQKEIIAQSRVNSTRALVTTMRKAHKKPVVLINASAVGYYGPSQDEKITEESTAGSGFLAKTCEDWELEAARAKNLGVRTVLLRIGIVLGPDGGALQKMTPPFKFFVGGPIGSGQQWFPWIHRDDVIGIIQTCIDNTNISGPVNATAPEPVRMREFCKVLGRVMNRPSWAPVPGFMLKILLGEMAEMLLSGQRAVPAKMLRAGYAFKYTRLENALLAALK